MKTHALSLNNALITGILFALIMLAGCAKDPAMLPEPATDSQDDFLKTSIVLTPAEIESLIYMVEEEKLAMDVYDYFFNMYGLQIFDRISDSEIKHVAAVSKFFVKYDLENPILDKDPGEFVNADLQQTYYDLIEMGSVSRNHAIEAAILIEEQDIIDINQYLTVVVAKDLVQAYNHLLLGSEKHLFSFELELN